MAQMYKVFIDNKDVIFKINPNFKNKYLTKKEIWKKIKKLKNSKHPGLIITIKNEKKFWDIFDKYIYIEAAGGLVQKDDEFLFIKRNGVWDIPKGKLERDEKIKKAAIREIEEECGLKKPKIKEHLIDTWHTYTMNNRLYLKRTYWFWLTEGKKKTKLKPQGEEGITKVKFLPISKFKKVKKNTYQSIIDVMDALIKVKQ